MNDIALPIEAPAASGRPAALAPLLDRARTLWASPAVARARPAVMAVAVLAAIALAWALLRSPDWRPLYPGLGEADAAAVTDALAAANFDWQVNSDTGQVEVPADDVARARILLADEPVASLDPALAEGILGLLRDLARRDGLAVLVSLHQHDLADRYADRLLHLEDGCLRTA